MKNGGKAKTFSKAEMERRNTNLRIFSEKADIASAVHLLISIITVISFTLRLVVITAL